MEDGRNLAPGIRPCDGLYLARIQLRYPLRDFPFPLFFGG